MIRIERLPTDYGRGPKRWMIMYTPSGIPRSMFDFRVLPVIQVLLHPFKAYRYLRDPNG